MLTLSLVRHGQTEYNAQGRLQGWSDSPLTSDGLADVRATAARLAARPFMAAYVSPSGRAQATAREILAHHRTAAFTTLPSLREFCFGEYEERPDTELYAEVDPITMYPAVVHGTFPGLPGGERGDEFIARVSQAFARIERRHPQGHVLVVSHGLTLKSYLTTIDPRPMAELPNASVSTVEVHTDRRRRVVELAAVGAAVRTVWDRPGLPSPVADRRVTVRTG